MIIRPTTDADFDALKAIQKEQGFAYDFPKERIAGATVEIDGKVNRAVLLRKTAEAYYILPPQRNLSHEDIKRELGIMFALHKEAAIPLLRMNFTDVHAWVPPEISERFGKLMMHFGWSRPLWPCYKLELR